MVRTLNVRSSLLVFKCTLLHFSHLIPTTYEKELLLFPFYKSSSQRLTNSLEVTHQGNEKRQDSIQSDDSRTHSQKRARGMACTMLQMRKLRLNQDHTAGELRLRSN